MTTENVAKLQDLVNWHAAASPGDWEALRVAVGVSYPAEFRDLVDHFPPGTFQTFLNILHPADHSPTEYREYVKAHAWLVHDWAVRLKEPIAGSLKPGALLPWATVGFDVMICWLTDDEDPDDWPVVVCDVATRSWNRYDLPAAAFLEAVFSEPTPVSELVYVSQAVQPPVFTTMHEVPGARAPAPSAEYWLDGVETGPLAEPFNAVEQLRPLVKAATIEGFDVDAFMSDVRQTTLPADFEDLLTALGGVTVGPAKVLAPDGSATDFFTERSLLAARIKAARKDGAGPLGTIHPEYDGLILWGRLDGGGYLCWVPLPEGNSFEWPVVVLDATMRMSITYRMSASRFLLELATHPERVPLPLVF